MAYLGTPPRSRVLSSADIDPGSVSLDDISFTDQPASMNISGNIDKHTMRLADQVVVNGDLDITDNLILSKISDDGNAITLTNDSSTRTIEGTGGSLEASTLTQTPNASLTGMTGEIGSAVSLGSATFPSGKVNNVFRFYDGTSGNVTVNGTTTAKVASDPWHISCTSGRHYIVIGSQYAYAHRASGTPIVRDAMWGLWYGTTDRTMGDNQTGDTFLTKTVLGVQLIANSDQGAPAYMNFNYQGYFTAASTATHYVYTAISLEASNGVEAVAHNATNNPHVATILEVMP